MAAWRGTRSTAQVVTNERPEHYFQGVARLYPNSLSAPLTVILTKLKKGKVTDSTYHWWTRSLPTQGGAATEVYTDASLSTPYVYASHQATSGIAGATVYVKCAEAVSNEIRIGHTVVLRDTDHLEADVVARVVNVVDNGASSSVACRLLEADDNGGATYNIATVDRILVIGSASSEGSISPQSITYQNTEYYNYTQIFRTPCNITGTMLETELRTEEAQKDYRINKLEEHMLLLEKAFIWGIRRSETSEVDGMPIRYTWGLVPMLRETVPTHVNDYRYNTDYSGENWTVGGEDWMKAYLKEIFRYGSTRKTAICGMGTIWAIDALAQTSGQIQLKPGDSRYGLQIMEWITPAGILEIIPSAVFSHETSTDNAMLIIEPDKLDYCHVRNRDTKFVKASDEAAGNGYYDGKHQEWLTEAGLKWEHPHVMGFLSGFGQNNTV